MSVKKKTGIILLTAAAMVISGRMRQSVGI